MPSVTLDDIRAARERISDVIYHSPCPYSLSLSRLCGAEVYCKLDHLQMTGSFKERGARNKLLLLPPEQRQRGVIAASAGNHALALAYHGHDLGIAVTVVMPKWSPLVKVKNCRSFGANILLHGDAYDDAKREAKRLAEEKGLTYIPGFDDPDIIAGQGTVGLEILEDVPDVDLVICPVGGGGLIAGVGRALKSRNYRLFFGGQSISLLGTWLTRVATSWLMYRISGVSNAASPEPRTCIAFDQVVQERLTAGQSARAIGAIR